MDKTVRGRARTWTERGNMRGGATLKRQISRTLLSINLHILVILHSCIEYLLSHVRHATYFLLQLSFGVKKKVYCR